MPHFFIPPENIAGNKFTLTGDEVHHLIRVRRCTAGSTIQLFDGTGKTYNARIDEIEKNSIRGTIINETSFAPPRVRLHLFLSVPKGERFDWMVEKASELGVHSITPLVTSRSIIKNIEPPKLERWKRLSMAASQQSRRPDIMAINSPQHFPAAIAQVSRQTVNLIPWEAEEAKTLDEYAPAISGASGVTVFIGPEGGFSADEIRQAEDRGLMPVTLGKRILRVETAGLLAAILVLNCAGEFR